MSRHRVVRSLNAADILADDNYYDDYEDYDDENYEMSPEDKAKMDEGKELVRNVIGKVEEISDKDIENALWYYYYNIEDTVTYLLDELHKSEAKKATLSQKKSGSNKSTPAKKDLLSNIDHLVNGKRYPSPVNFDAKQQNPECHYSLGNKTRTIFTNCVSSNDIWLGHHVKWSSLAQSNLMFAEKSIYEMQKSFHHGGLLGGADSETPKSIQSRLSSLRDRFDSTRETISSGSTNKQEQTSFSNLGTRSSGPSLLSLAKSSVNQSKRPSLSSLATNTSSKLEPESFTKSQTSSNLKFNSQAPSLSSLAQKSVSQSIGRNSLTRFASNRTGLIPTQSSVMGDSKLTRTSLVSTLANKLDNKSSLQETKTPIISKQSTTLPALSSLNEMVKQESQPIRSDQNQISEITQSLIDNKESIQNSYSNIQSLSNPLIAPPSIFAISIFEQLQDNLVPPNDLITFEIYIAGSNNSGFSFNGSSPDDIVLKAQKKKGTSIQKDKVKQDASPSSSSPVLKATPKSESKGKQPITVSLDKEDEDDVIDILDEEDDDEQLRFDMKALNLGLENELKASSSKTIKSVVNQKSTPTIPSSTPKLSSKHKRIDVLEEYKKRSANKVALNLVVIGHVDAGKSTLMGHLLYLLGEVNEKTMKKYERDSSKIGKSSFAYAWILDETGEERSRGITMDIAITKFETEHRRFTLLDAPGHRDFIPNMISGAAQADVAVLVVDATTGEFEAGFEANGQTKEHALLVRSLGVQQLVIAINKLDVVDWSQDRYNEIITKLNPFLMSQAGFKKDKVTYIPCSGLTGENLLKKSQNILEWYSGPTLVQQIDKFEPPTRLLDKAFRLSVSDFFKGGIGNTSGVTVAGRIEAGTIQIGEDVIVIPGGEHGLVKGLETNNEPSKWAAAGDSILLTLTGLDIIQLKIGSILCSTSHPVLVTSHFFAQILVFDVKVPITKGFPVILHRQSLNEPATISKLVAIVDKSTGEVAKKNPRCLPKASTATVEIKLTNRPIPLETYKENKELGRIMLRKGGETVAAGIVIDILSYNS